ncbi:hypothetical protein [Streptomyces mirabilis]|uniref:hypothetical protein n=1 Tax=Streptomyces mirabilis TaxID=68239 RepID=UPI0036DE22B4
MLHTVFRRRANGESVEQIQPDLIIPTGKRKGQGPSIYRALAGHEKKEAYDPEAVAQAHADFADLQDANNIPRPRRVRIGRPDDPLTPEETRPSATTPGPGPPTHRDRAAVQDQSLERQRLFRCSPGDGQERGVGLVGEDRAVLPDDDGRGGVAESPTEPGSARPW